MEMEITIPEVLPVMTLPEVTFFPQALLPLRIFEPRYRQMLRDVLAADRLFAVAGLKSSEEGATQQFEPPHRIASVGIVRACQKNADGTSNLLLQGLCRAELIEIVNDEPYRRARVRPLSSEFGASPDTIQALHAEVMRLIDLKEKFGAPLPSDITSFLRGVADPETFVDLAAFNLCEDVRLRQRLLETLDLNRRLTLFARQLRLELEALKLRQKLQGSLGDDEIPLN